MGNCRDTGMNLREDTRLQAHQAVQLIAAAGVAYIRPKEDDSHTNMQWLPGIKAWGSGKARAGELFRIALDMTELTFYITDESAERITARFALHGKSFEESIEWFLDNIESMGGDRTVFNKKLHFDIPENPYTAGKLFDTRDKSSFRALNSHFLCALETLKEAAKGRAGGMRIWPHHFDLGTLIDLNKGRMISMGLSPGDNAYNEPYYYVSPWPYPDASIPLDDNKLAADGFWHTRGFTAAVLTAGAYNSYEDRKKRIIAFLQSAIAYCETLLTNV